MLPVRANILGSRDRLSGCPASGWEARSSSLIDSLRAAGVDMPCGLLLGGGSLSEDLVGNSLTTRVGLTDDACTGNGLASPLLLLRLRLSTSSSDPRPAERSKEPDWLYAVSEDSRFSGDDMAMGGELTRRRAGMGGGGRSRRGGDAARSSFDDISSLLVSDSR